MKQERYGFTLIETTLVLAIAGLILTMVFLALPALVANQRDAERRDDMMLFINKLKSYQANNNRGALPTPSDAKGLESGVKIDGGDISYGDMNGNTWKDFYAGFFNEDYRDPDGARYNWEVIRCKGKVGNACENSELTNENGPYKGSLTTNDHTMYIIVAASCDGINAVASTNARSVAVVYALERSHVYCTNS